MLRFRFVLFALVVCVVAAGVHPAAAQSPVSITLKPEVRYQTMVGWEATAQAGQFEFLDLYPRYRDAVLDAAVNDLGINRLRVEVFGGMENPTDWFARVLSRQITADEYSKVHAAEIVNDNQDPNSINSAGFKWSFLDHQMDNLVLPMRQRLQARGEKLFINVNYVDFRDPPAGSCAQCFEHYNYPEEYAEFVLATYQHLRSKYGLQPDAWEVILEPDNSNWRDSSGVRVGRALYAAATLLRRNGITPAFIVPSVMDMNHLIPYITGMKVGIKQQGNLTDAQVTQFLRDNVKELSYHRYVSNDSVLSSLLSTAKPLGIRTAQLEHINADYNELHRDLKIGNNSAWQQYCLAYPYTSGSDGAAYYRVLYSNPNSPTIELSSRAKFLRQYFKFIRAGAVRVEATTSDAAFDPVAFQNANGKYVVVIKATRGGSFTIKAASSGSAAPRGAHRVYLPFVASNGGGANPPGPVTGGLPAGTYGIKYTTGSAYDVNLKDVSLGPNGSLTASIPAAGVITIY